MPSGGRLSNREERFTLFLFNSNAMFSDRRLLETGVWPAFFCETTSLQLDYKEKRFESCAALHDCAQRKAAKNRTDLEFVFKLKEAAAHNAS